MKHTMLKASCGALFLLCGQATLAHNANIAADTFCDAETGTWKISYTSTTWDNCENDNWDPDGLSCANDRIGIYLYEVTVDTPDEAAARLLLEPNNSGEPMGPLTPFIGEGAFGPSNTSSFSGHLVSPTQIAGETVFVTAKPIVNWADGFLAPTNRLAPSGQQAAAGQQYRATSVTIPGTPCDPPNEGGPGLTPGYWGAWSSCSKGRQFDKATEEFLAGLDPRHITLDENLPKTVGLLFIAGDTTGGSVYDGDNDAQCEIGVRILKSQTVDEGENSSNDAAYNLARSQLAYLLNTSGAQPSYDCQLAQDASDAAQILLAGIGFDGTGEYLVEPSALREEALALNDILDLYNNNELGELCD